MTDRLHCATEEGARRMQWGGEKRNGEKKEGQWSEKLKEEQTFFYS